MRIERLQKDILSSKICREVFRQIQDAYLVGGYIRDRLIGKETRDYDFAIPSTAMKEAIDALSSVLGGKVINFSRFNFIRIALRNRITVDFTPCDDIEVDLARRDFTINAIAFNPDKGIYDPHNGLKDLSDRLVRAVSDNSIKADPVRIIRAFRFKGLLGGEISDSTLEAIKRYKETLKDSPIERITLEFFKLLELESPEGLLGEMVDCGVTRVIFCHDINDFDKIKKEISYLSQNIKASRELFHRELEEEIGQQLSRRGLLYLLILMKYSGDPGKTLLGLSGKILRRVGVFIEKSDDRCLIFHEDLESLYGCLRSLEPIVIEKIIYDRAFDIYAHFRRYQEIIRRPPLSGRDISVVLKIPPCKRIAELKEMVNKGFFSGRLHSREEALEYLREII